VTVLIKKRLERIAGDTAEFLGYVSEEEKHRLILGCRALIQTQKEDFGIVPVEVMSLGKPVIAYGEGGALETVLENETGEFFAEQTAESLKKVLENFNEKRYQAALCIDRAKKFDKKTFKKELKNYMYQVAENII
jgi:glycosyltransferase involved in cell wall biosynthesis